MRHSPWTDPFIYSVFRAVNPSPVFLTSARSPSQARELIQEGHIGDIVAVNGDFGYTIANGAPAAVRGDPATGGMTLGECCVFVVA